MTTETLKPVDLKPRCYFCNKEVGEEEFCFGCGEYVCDDCDETVPVESHDVEDHKQEEADG